MISVNQRGQTSDILQQLENETGVFQATSPSGKRYTILANQGSIVCQQPSSQQQQPQSGQYAQSSGGQQFQSGGQWSYVKTAELAQQQGQF